MKKTVLALLSTVLVFSLLLAPISEVDAGGWDDPVVIPLSGDKDFTVKSVDPITLSLGTAKTENGLTVPSGFPPGEMQFGGNALIIEGLESGKVTACFSFPTHRYGWEGGIYQWKGSRWSVMPSTLTKGVEGAATNICATINGDGTYALLTVFAHPELLPKGLPVCADDFDIFPMSFSPESEPGEQIIAFLGLQINKEYPIGTPISYSFFNIVPSGVMTGALSQTGNVFISNPTSSIVLFITPDEFPAPPDPFLFPERTLITLHHIEGWEDMNYTLRITTPTCYKDFSFEDINTNPT